MELLKEIMELANKDIVVDYIVVDQKRNGITNGTRPEKTYTISIVEVDSYSGNLIETQSFDDLEEGLMWGIKKGNVLLYRMK